ncbi:TPA: glycosyltransferase family 25 protein, partial [Mannheimia haemolytica]|nr:glycosyltransferase family 25 protein [Mannheimia haemolytica]
MNNYVISLTSAQERRKHIEAEFGKQNIPFQFFDAITPDLIKEKAKAFNIDISNTNLTKGEIACALSHIALWHLAKQQNLDYICIFEDDIYLGNNAFELLKTNYIPENTHIVKLETLPFDRINRFNKTEKYILNRRLFKLNSRHVGMAGYILTNKGAEFLINILKTLNIPIDDLIFDEYLKIKEYKVLQMSPALCVQDFILNSKTNFKSSL